MKKDDLFWLCTVIACSLSGWAIYGMDETSFYAAAFFGGVALSLFMFDGEVKP